MRQMRWAGGTMAIATALVISGGLAARADIASDKPAAIVIYPKILVDEASGHGVDTVIRLTNTNTQTPIQAHCFFLDANSHCVGGTNEGKVCSLESPTFCAEEGGFCAPGWQEIDFHILLTPGQPIEWKASDGLAGSRTCDKGTQAGQPCKIAADCSDTAGVIDGKCTLGLPLPGGVCANNPFVPCGSDNDCNPFPGGKCTQSNAGTAIPGVPEDSFVGELKCIAIDSNNIPVPRNDLKGDALIETSTAVNLDVASYNAIGIQATGVQNTPTNVLQLGGDGAEYNGCSNFLILNHFFDNAKDPVPGSTKTINTDITFVPCSEDLLRQIPGSAVVQYLVFNEFEQRFSTSRSVKCFQEIQLCNIDTTQCARSIFNVNVAGTLTGQTRINPIGIAMPPPNPGIPSGLLGIAIEQHCATLNADGSCATPFRSAAFNLNMQGARDNPDTITLP